LETSAFIRSELAEPPVSAVWQERARNGEEHW
jgi:hypothetical protein